MIPITYTSSASIRFGISDRATAAIACGFLHDLIQAGHLDQEKDYLALNRSKVARRKVSVIKTAQEKWDQDTSDSDIKAVFFDGRKESTKVFEFDNITK